MVGTRQRVLVERGGTGHSENFAPVRVKGHEVGKVVEVTITGIEGGILIGEAA
jgi:threonylcarbamoyladenosine tRNA methylthiotransferase MtaB